jgi:tripartite-type tricarboxylate transporter receptor subunit TctC
VFPDVATLREQGHPDIVMTAWSGVFAPRGRPPAVMEKLSAALRQASASTAAVESRRRSGSVDPWRTLPESRAFLASEIARRERCVRESGVGPE